MERPRERTRMRRRLGREAYIVQRRIAWLDRNKAWAAQQPISGFRHQIAAHSSVIIRPDADRQMQENKRINMALAMSQLNGVVCEPGRTISFWKLVGRPSKRRGYLDGLVLNQGDVATGAGGGLCQLGSLLFWLFAHTPLDITERHGHSHDVFADQNRAIPFGGGATVAFNYLDLQVENRTVDRFALEVWEDATHLRTRLLGERRTQWRYEIEERNHQITQQPWGGHSRHNQLVQIAVNGRGDRIEKLIAENHALMTYNPFLNAGSVG